jgi:hypothetical protein
MNTIVPVVTVLSLRLVPDWGVEAAVTFSNGQNASR